MADNSRRRNIVIVVIVLLLVLLALLLLTKCKPRQPTNVLDRTPPVVGNNTPTPATAASQPAATEPDEVLSPATLTAPATIAAGAVISITWTGPDNPRDYITIAAPDAAADSHLFYNDAKHGSPLPVTAPIEPGVYELRYVAGRSRTILGRAPIEVIAAAATVEGPAEITIGTIFNVTWSGPNNDGDFITIVAPDAPDDRFTSYADADTGSPKTLTAPIETGEYELRYVTGQGRKVLARRAIKVIAAAVSLTAPDEAIAGSNIAVTWTGPNNSGDYITIVPAATPDGQYRNYTNTASGSPLNLLTPIDAGDAEIRYMTGQGAKVLARRAIKINAAVVTLAAAAEAKADSDVSITWTGPNHAGDYITIVPKSAPDGEYRGYTNTTAGSPLNVKAPKDAGDAEIRYMTGQGGKVLARIPIKIVP